MSISKAVQRILDRNADAIGNLTPEESAILCAEILALASVNRDTVNALLEHMTEDDRGELIAQVQGYMEDHPE